MSSRGLFFITNHENAPRISRALTHAFPVVISRERTDLSIDPDAEFQFFSTEYIKAPFAERVGSATYREIEPVLDLALNNGHTFYILERLRYFNGGQKTDPFRNCFNYLPHLQEMVLRATDLVLASEADYLVFSSTPHDIEAWLTFLVAASQGKKVYAVGQSELPWRAYVKEIRPDASLGCRTVDYFPQRTADQPSASHAPSEDVRRYIARKQKDYVDAEPDYMKNQKSGKTRKDRGARLKKSLRRAFEGREPKNRDSISNVDREISKLLTNFRSRRLRAALSRFAVSRLPESPFVTVFLHFQPERTSIPEGGRYAPQINAVKALRDALPEATELVVKEHPSMFMLKSKRSFRHPDFYRILASMPGVTLVDERMASFDLIDESEAVVTLTGTVGFEALCRGTPVIVMGDAAYRSYPGVVDLYDRPMADIDLIKEIGMARQSLSGETVIESSAGFTEAVTISDDKVSELLSGESMGLCLHQLADHMKRGGGHTAAD